MQKRLMRLSIPDRKRNTCLSSYAANTSKKLNGVQMIALFFVNKNIHLFLSNQLYNIHVSVKMQV